MDIMINWPAPAKLNLFLYVTGKRSNDAYHNLQTLFQLLDYGDTLTFALRSDSQLNLKYPINGVPGDSNLIIVSARLLQNYAIENKLVNKNMLGIDIAINKKLPIGAGLGGGSSNAATVLLALNSLWQLALPQHKIMALGRQIGADVPFFIKGHSSFAEGTGSILTPIDLPEHWFLIITPFFSVSTATIFSHPDLNRTSPVKSLDEHLTVPFHNDCESLVRKLYPELNKLMNHINNSFPVRLTGTGSSFFACFETEKEARYAQQQLPKSVISFIAKGINTSPLQYLLQE